MIEYTEQDVAGLISGIAIPAEAKCGESLASWLARELNELEQLRSQQGEAVGWITEEGLFTKVPVTVFIKTGKWTPVYLHPPADQAIGVPTSELEKLEESRVALYDFLDTKLDEFEMQDLINITGQIWKVANTKKWQAQADTNTKGWYCAHCERGVDSSEVTFHEQHQECGRVITNDYPPKKDTVRVPVPKSTDLTKQLINAISTAGADDLSEDELLAQGIHFGNYEAGFGKAVEIISRRVRDIFKAAQGEG